MSETTRRHPRTTDEAFPRTAESAQWFYPHESGFDGFLSLLVWVCVAVMVLAFVLMMAWMYPTMTLAKQADCSMVEFSPDIAADVKQACRQARSKR